MVKWSKATAREFWNSAVDQKCCTPRPRFLPQKERARVGTCHARKGRYPPSAEAFSRFRLLGLEEIRGFHFPQVFGAEAGEEDCAALDRHLELASDEGFALAVEAHCNAMIDRTERAIWLMEALDNPLIRLHFDIVHFYLAREPIAETVHKLVPYTAHTHVTDARIYDDKFELLLLGQGELDCVEYVKAMHEAGWTDFITVEVSTMVWSKQDYDPLEAASLSYKTLDKAFKEAGVTRT